MLLNSSSTSSTVEEEAEAEDEETTLDSLRTFERTLYYKKAVRKNTSSTLTPSSSSSSTQPHPQEKSNGKLLKTLLQKQSRLHNLKLDVDRVTQELEMEEETVKKKRTLQLSLLRLEASYGRYSKEDKALVKGLYDEYSRLKKKKRRLDDDALGTVYEDAIIHEIEIHPTNDDVVDALSHDNNDIVVLEEQQETQSAAGGPCTNLASQLETLQLEYLPLRREYHSLTKNNRSLLRRKEEKRLLFPDYDNYKRLRKQVKLLTILVGKL